MTDPGTITVTDLENILDRFTRARKGIDDWIRIAETKLDGLKILVMSSNPQSIFGPGLEVYLTHPIPPIDGQPAVYAKVRYWRAEYLAQTPDEEPYVEIEMAAEMEGMYREIKRVLDHLPADYR